MSDYCDEPNDSDETGKMDPYDLFRKSFNYWQAAVPLGEIPTNVQLAAALEANLGEPIPDYFVMLVVQALRGELKQKRGRRPLAMGKKPFIGLVRECYHQYLSSLQKGEKIAGLEDWSCTKEADWQTLPPHEQAAEMVRERFRLESKTARTILNLLSSQK